jgi:hypothetical protein
LVEARLLQNLDLVELRKMVGLVAVVVVTPVQEEPEQQVRLDKVMTVALLHNRVMVAVVVLAHQAEMEILQME